MSAYGYSYVSDQAFVAFASDLAEGAWKGVFITKHDNTDQVLSPAASAAGWPVAWKLRLAWAIAGLKEALASSKLDKLDAAFDGAERRLYHRLAGYADDKSPAIREAAGRLGDVLLMGGGTGQTTLDYDAEVDFGRKQRELTLDGQAAADVKLLKLGDVLQDVAEATEALAEGIGRKAGGKRASAPSIRVREATAACSAAFNGVHDDIAWFIEHTPPGEGRDELIALQAPLEALLARNPPPAPVKVASPTVPAPPASAAPKPA